MAKKPKDDGTRSGHMEGPRLPRVQKSQGMTLEEAAKLPPIPDEIAKRFIDTSVVRPSQTIHQILYEDKVPLRDQTFPALAEGGKTPTGRNKTLPQFIDFETRSEVPLRPTITAEIIAEAHRKFPGRTLEYVDLPDGAVGLRPYQREMLQHVMETVPVTTPLEGETYEGFKNRYGRGGPSRRYGGRMSDYLRQHSYFASGDPDPLRGAAGRRFFALGGGEGNRQLAYYAYGMALSQTADNWVDDVYDRKQRRAEAKLREYCMADVMWFGDYVAIERNILINLLIGYTPHAHLLKAPYGREASSPDWGIAISIRFTGLRPRGFVQDDPVPEWPDRQLADMIGGAVTGFGCPEWIARKAAETMFASGRYDCCVTLSKHALRNLEQVMQELRCEVVVVCTDRRGWMNYAPDSDRDIR